MSAVINLNVKSYIPPSMLAGKEFLNWYCTTAAFTDKPRSWTMGKLVDAICRFDTILQRTYRAEDQIRLRYSTPITNFMSYMIEVHAEAEVAVN